MVLGKSSLLFVFFFGGVGEGLFKPPTSLGDAVRVSMFLGT